MEKGALIGKYIDRNIKNKLELTIMPTEQCNFRCSYCYEEYERGTITTYNATALLKCIQRLLKNYTSLHIAWFGGEPLMAYEEIVRISKKVIEMCSWNNRNYTSSMTTNGYLLTEERFKVLHDLHVYSYQITIDGLQEYHDAQRRTVDGKGTYKVIIDNLDTIKAIRFNDHIVPDIMIRMNFTKNMYNDRERIIEEFGKKFSAYPNISFLFRTAGDYGGDSVKRIKDEILPTNTLSEIYKSAAQCKYKINIINQVRMLKESGCYATRKNSFVIGSDLSVYKCTVHFKESVVGKILQDGTFDIDYSKNALWYTAPLIALLNDCGECESAGSCLASKCPYGIIYGLKSRENCAYKEDDELEYWINKTYNDAKGE